VKGLDPGRPAWFWNSDMAFRSSGRNDGWSLVDWDVPKASGVRSDTRVSTIKRASCSAGDAPIDYDQPCCRRDQICLSRR
jgi:hypothetical protein